VSWFLSIDFFFFIDKLIDIVSTTSIMVDDKYREALNQAIAEVSETRKALDDLQAQREQKEKRLVELREFIVATSKMLGEDYAADEEDILGLTDAVRQAYKTSPVAISHVGVAKHFAKIGYDLSKYDSPASATASIHKVVSRLAEKREIIPTGVNTDGRTVYKWAGTRMPVDDPVQKLADGAKFRTPGEYKRTMEALRPKK
jgi:Arc/MetJ-type ribon-helix-helix transcriptional regulator